MTLPHPVLLQINWSDFITLYMPNTNNFLFFLGKTLWYNFKLSFASFSPWKLNSPLVLSITWSHIVWNSLCSPSFSFWWIYVVILCWHILKLFNSHFLCVFFAMVWSHKLNKLCLNIISLKFKGALRPSVNFWHPVWLGWQIDFLNRKTTESI